MSPGPQFLAVEMSRVAARNGSRTPWVFHWTLRVVESTLRVAEGVEVVAIKIKVRRVSVAFGGELESSEIQVQHRDPLYISI